MLAVLYHAGCYMSMVTFEYLKVDLYILMLVLGYLIVACLCIPPVYSLVSWYMCRTEPFMV